MKFAARVAALVALWLLAWGSISLAKIAAGVVLAVGLLLLFPSSRAPTPELRFRPVASLRLVGYVLVQLVTSNLLVAREVLARRSNVRTGVIAHPMGDAPDAAVALLANLIALTPGTMTVEATRSPACVYVHVLLLDDVDGARRAIGALDRLVSGALGIDPDHGRAAHQGDEP
jgi:multicomponent Na+:H+ antiporter subunit E